MTEPGETAVAHERAPRSRLFQVSMIGLLILVSSTLALVLAEVMIRTVVPQQLIQIRPDIWKPADTLGWTSRPFLNTTVNTGERTVSVITDAEGLRIGVAGRQESELRVLLLGDSFMQALQVEHKQSIAGLLEIGLTRRLDRTVAVWNAGVDGWDPPQYYMRARSLLDQYPFDLVIVALYLGNDVVEQRRDVIPPREPNKRHLIRFPRTLAWGEIIDAVLYPTNDFLETRLHLYVFLKIRLHTLLMRADLTAQDVPTALLRTEAESHRWELTSEICADIANAAAEHGVSTLFVPIPAPFSTDPDAFRELVRGFGMDPTTFDLDQPDRLLRAALERSGLEVVPVLDAFRRAHAAGTQVYGSVDRHLTPSGHVVLQQILEPAAASHLRSRQ